MDIAKLPPGSASVILFLILLATGCITALCKKYRAARYITKVALFVSLVLLYFQPTWGTTSAIWGTLVLLLFGTGLEKERIPYISLAVVLCGSLAYTTFW